MQDLSKTMALIHKIIENVQILFFKVARDKEPEERVIKDVIKGYDLVITLRKPDLFDLPERARLNPDDFEEI